ncbi:MAG: hypothetical protein D3910_13015, partial [Candidatus Electrothrix sp. ATG2]|nr:hypothetical protein [Candidatus Electrothrix sp. ATG2]
ITASAFKEQYQKIIEAGCDDVTHKPYQTREIFDVMADQLGVRYTYEEESEATTDTSIDVSAEAIAALPKVLRESLRTAALSLRKDNFEPVLNSVREYNPALAEGVARLAQDFLFDRVLELLEKAKKDKQ